MKIIYYSVQRTSETRMLPSDELHTSEPLSFQDFKGITIHDALIIQRAIRTRTGMLKGNKQKAEDELRDIDLTLSIYVTEEVRLQEAEDLKK